MLGLAIVPDRRLILLRGAAEFAAIKSMHGGDSCWVIPQQDRPSENTLVNGVRQQVEAEFAVVMRCKNLRDRRGEASSKDLRNLRQAVQDALLDYEPASADGMIVYRGGRLLQVESSAIFWQDLYSVNVIISGI